MKTSSFAKFGKNKREEYFEALRSGCWRYKAARTIGISRELIRMYRELHPEFAIAEQEAEDEANDEIENALFQAAQSGNVTACQVWLYNRRSERWKDQRGGKVDPLEAFLASLSPEQRSAALAILGKEVPDSASEARQPESSPP